MIDSAVKILGPVPAANIDPLLLIQSQTPDVSGYVMTSYLQDSQNHFYDILMFQSNEIFGSFRMTPDLRFALDVTAVLQMFRTHKADSSASVSLYKVPMEQLSKFRDTIRYTPSLKLKPDGMTRKQIVSAMEAVDFESAYLELDDFTNVAEPVITVLDVNHNTTSVSTVFARFTNAQLRSSNRLLLYDIDKNKAAVSQSNAHPSPVLGEGLGEGGVCKESEHSLDSILQSILASSTTHTRPHKSTLPLPADRDEPTMDSSKELVPDDPPSLPATQPASPQLIALFAELRSALVALLGRARAARVLNRALASSSPEASSDLRQFINADPAPDQPAIEREEDAQVLISATVDATRYLAINKRKAREKLARILADSYSHDYSGFTPDELKFLESLWKRVVR
ncbi:MAG: hypothetical protein M1469_09315 [Bacteroidetes bacterium]|nr:hypothetical protein [Bacteroidota bacterium]